MLRDMLERICGSVSQELQLNLVAMDAGSPDRDRSEAAVRAMSDNLKDGVDTAVQLHRGPPLRRRLTWAAYGGRLLDLAQACWMLASGR